MEDTPLPAAAEPTRRIAPASGRVFPPDVDVAETADAFVVTADLPGVDPAGVRVGFEHGVLTIEGAISISAPDPGCRLVHAEVRSGSFHRRFHLSDRIDASAISARMCDGVLTLRLPKAERYRTRRIEVAV